MPPALGLLAGLAVCASAVGVGRALLGRWVAGGLSLGERWALFSWVGLTLLAYLVLAVGLLGLLGWPVLLGVVLVFSGVGAWLGRDAFADVARLIRRPRWGGLRTVLWVCVALAIVFVVTGALNPPVTNEYDSLTYHLAAPKLYLSAGMVYRIEYDHHTNSPFNLEMLYTLGLAFGSESMAKSFHVFVYLMLVASVAGAARRLAEDRTGRAPAIAAAVVGCLPPIVWEAGTAYVDLGVTLGEWLAVLMLVEWLRDRSGGRRRWLLLCGVACGTALATKVLGGVALLFAVLVMAFSALRERRIEWRGAAGLGLLAAALCFPWYVKSWAYTGNPVYPYAYSVFGGADWDETCARMYREDQKTYGLGGVVREAQAGGYRATSFLTRQARPGGPVEPAGPVSRAITRLLAQGLPGPWLGIPLVPLFLTFDGTVFWERPMTIGLVGPLFLALLPAVALRRPLRAWLGVPLAFAALNLCVWWFTAQLTRYLLPSLVACAIPVAVGAEALSAGPALVRRLIGGLVICSTAVCLAASAVMWTAQIGPAVGTVSRDDAIRMGFEQMPLFETANRMLGPTDKIALYGEPRGYYLDVPYMWADYGHNTLLKYDGMASPGELLAAWGARGVTAVLVDKRYARPTYEGTDWPGRLMKPLREAGVLATIRETATGVLYRVNPTVPSRGAEEAGHE